MTCIQCHYVCSILILYPHLGCCISGPCACLFHFPEWHTLSCHCTWMTCTEKCQERASGPEISDVWMSEQANPFGTETDLRTKNSLFLWSKMYVFLVRSLFLSSALPKSTFIFTVQSQQFVFWWKYSVGLLVDSLFTSLHINLHSPWETMLHLCLLVVVTKCRSRLSLVTWTGPALWAAG